jgi:hypothetical protein
MCRTRNPAIRRDFLFQDHAAKAKCNGCPASANKTKGIKKAARLKVDRFFYEINSFIYRQTCC